MSVAAPGARAQDSAGEIAQLKALVQQQAATLKALQNRLSAIEARQQRTAAQVAAVQAAPPPPAAPAAAPILPAPLPVAATPPLPPAKPATGVQPFAVLSGNERVNITVSGQINREVLFVSDGSGKTDTYFADNNVSSTRLRVLGTARLDNDTQVLSALEFDLRSNNSAAVSRQSENNNGGDTPNLGPFRVRRAEIGVRSDVYGTIMLGRGSTFGDGIAEYDLSGTVNSSYSAASDQGGALQFARTSFPFRRAGDPTIAQTLDNFDGPRDDRARYDSPSWNGFSLGASIAQGQYFDFGGRYSGEIAGAKVAGGVAYLDNRDTLPSNNPQNGNQSATTVFSQRVAGSATVLFPNGINISGSLGWGKHYANCCALSVPANKDSFTWYAKVGYQVRLFDFAKTNFSVDAQQTHGRIQNGDHATRVGIQVAQPILGPAFEIYAAYEHLMLERRGAKFNPVDFALVGSRVNF